MEEGVIVAIDVPMGPSLKTSPYLVTVQCISIRQALPQGWQDITNDMIVIMIGVLKGSNGHVNHDVTIKWRVDL